ncbi:MAG: T9SS type A sorting domain-containing protein [Calditrichia bacterium]
MRKFLLMFSLGLIAVLLFSTALQAQYPPREDVVWARDLGTSSITLDGLLNEPAWDAADSVMVIYGQDGPLPTSSWRPEFQPAAINDPTHATVKFLTKNNMLYLGFYIPDSSVGGNQDWARWDGILMSIKDRASSSRPTPPTEFFYAWWYVNIDSLVNPGVPPRFIGRWGNFDDTTRTAGQKAAWDARTVVHGGVSNDAGRDEAWSVEMRIALDSLGYDVVAPTGDIIELNFSIWDVDYLFDGNPADISSTRTWFQSPWNANADNVARIHARPGVTINSGPVPDVEPDMVLKNGSTLPMPTIDGMLSDDAWMYADSFLIRWNDENVRNSYPGVGPFRSGQFQPDVDTIPGLPPVLDSADAVIKMFFRDDYLYLAADVNDRLVQGTSVFDKMDMVRFIVGDRVKVDGDNRMQFQQLTASFDDAGMPAALDYLPVMLDSSNTEYAIVPKGATTINNNNDIDEGFMVEMKVDLQYLGYPAGLGDHLLFMGVMLGDGDSFLNPENDYGTRTWWFREHNNGPAAAWMVMDPNLYLSIDDNPLAQVPETVALYGNYPNPFNPNTEIRYSLPFAGEVNLRVFNVLGQEVAQLEAGKKAAGTHELRFDGSGLGSGIYFYRISVMQSSGSRQLNSGFAKMVILK